MNYSLESADLVKYRNGLKEYVNIALCTPCFWKRYYWINSVGRIPLVYGGTKVLIWSPTYYIWQLDRHCQMCSFLGTVTKIWFTYMARDWVYWNIFCIFEHQVPFLTSIQFLVVLISLVCPNPKTWYKYCHPIEHFSQSRLSSSMRTFVSC